MKCVIMLPTSTINKFIVRVFNAYMLVGSTKNQRRRFLVKGNIVFLMIFVVLMLSFFPFFERGSIVRDYVSFDNSNSRLMSCIESDEGGLEELKLSSGGQEYKLGYKGRSLGCEPIRENTGSYKFKTISGFIVEAEVGGEVDIQLRSGKLRLLMPLVVFYILVAASFTVHVMSRKGN